MANSSSLFYIIFFTTKVNIPLNFLISINFYVLLIKNNILYLVNELIRVFIGCPTNTSIVKFLAL